MNMSEINIAIKKIRKNIFGAMCDQDVVGMVIPDIGFWGHNPIFKNLVYVCTWVAEFLVSAHSIEPIITECKGYFATWRQNKVFISPTLGHGNWAEQPYPV